MTDYAAALWAALDDIRTGMLGLAGARQAHSQPMTMHHDDRSGTMFFFTADDSQLARAVREGGEAVFHYAGPRHALYACIHGTVSVDTDAATKRRLWTDEVAQWFTEGPDAPSVVLLRLEARRAQVWLNETTGGEFGFDADPGIDRRETIAL